jgi:hypothetical protein
MIFSVWEHPNFRVEGRESRWHHGCRLRVVSSDAVATVVVAQEVSGSASRPYDALLAQQEEGSLNQVNQSPAVPSKNCHRRLGPCTEKSPHQAVTPTATLVGTFHADCLRYSTRSVPRNKILPARHLHRQRNGCGRGDLTSLRTHARAF